MTMTVRRTGVMMTSLRAGGAIVAALAMLWVGGVVAEPTPAQAVTYRELLNAQNKKQESIQREAQLKAQLANVDSTLANKIIELDDLTNNQIPAAQQAVIDANNEAINAQDEADAAAERLKAAQQDKKELEEKIEATGKDYDDSQAAVAQVARDSFHGSSTSDVMSVVTGAKTTSDFVDSMQTREALSRTEANAANDAANTLSTSMNRSERLAAIEERIATLKNQADQKAQDAKTAYAAASDERERLDQLRAQGETMRSQLEDQQDQLSSAAAQQAAQTVLLTSQADDYNRQYQQQLWEAQQQQDKNNSSTGQSAGNNSGNSGGGSSSSGGSSSGGNSGSTSGGSSGAPAADYVYHNYYPWGQCTWWAYEYRLRHGLPASTTFGNGRQWGERARARGYSVGNTPAVNAIVSFQPGQAGADYTYGHVAVVIQVSGNSILVTESNVRGLGVISTRWISNATAYTYIY